MFVGATGPLAMPLLLREKLKKDGVIANNAAIMGILHMTKICAFFILGFAYSSYFYPIVFLIVAVSIGSYVVKYLRKFINEQRFKIFAKILLSILAVRIIRSRIYLNGSLLSKIAQSSVVSGSELENTM